MPPPKKSNKNPPAPTEIDQRSISVGAWSINPNHGGETNVDGDAINCGGGGRVFIWRLYFLHR
jgi:hypothetical protein